MAPRICRTGTMLALCAPAGCRNAKGRRRLPGDAPLYAIVARSALDVLREHGEAGIAHFGETAGDADLFGSAVLGLVDLQRAVGARRHERRMAGAPPHPPLRTGGNGRGA